MIFHQTIIHKFDHISRILLKFWNKWWVITNKTMKFTIPSMYFMEDPWQFHNDLSNQKFHRSFWLMFFFKVGEIETDCESGSMLHYRNKNHFWKRLFYRLHMYMHSESTSPSPRLLWTDLPTPDLAQTIRFMIWNHTISLQTIQFSDQTIQFYSKPYNCLSNHL